jgi:DDE superfamily endonuclease
MAGDEVAALRAFRAGVYAGLGRRRDALFEVLDALLTAGSCPSLPHLSLAPGHRRGWGSVYAALRRGHVEVPALRALPSRQPVPDGPPVYAVDVSVWPRPAAATSPERGYQYHSPRRRRAGGDPVVPG